ncbi:MAG: hypothetical protein AABW65_00740 [Nanoarchaeota archaeon]
MGTFEDIKRMQDEGKSEEEISAALQQRGLSKNEINSVFIQAKIKEAVSENAFENSSDKSSVNIIGMHPSLLEKEPLEPEPPVQQKEIPKQTAAPQSEFQSYPEQEYQEPPESQYFNNPQYEQYSSSSLSADTITEISEQLVLEKLSPLKDKLEEILDMKNNVESMVQHLDERLKRIEKIIDRLQLSILQKVGEYMTNIEDIKKEIIETQKSFIGLSNQKSIN